METILAVDFGTSNSLAGAWHEGRRIEALPLDPRAADPTLMRTLLYFPHANECHYGADAVRAYLDNDMQGRLFRSFKTHLPNRQYLGTFVDARVLPLEHLIGIFLLELRKRAENALEAPIASVVMGRPARYALDPAADNFALHRMQKACEFAGFSTVHFVPEPLAAALDFRRGLHEEKLVLVGDFGGGTSDFTLLRIGPKLFHKDDVLGLDGCPLAGDALDSLFMSERLNLQFGAKARYRMPLGRNILTMPKAIIERLNQPAHIVHLHEPATYEFIEQVRKGAIDASDREAVERLFVLIEDQQIFPLFEAIEFVKRALSDQEQFALKFRYPELDLDVPYQRNEFVQWADPTRARIFAALDSCLQMAGASANDVDLVCLTGGSAKVPLIREELVRRFGSEKLQTQAHFHSVLSGLIESAAQAVFV